MERFLCPVVVAAAILVVTVHKADASLPGKPDPRCPSTNPAMPVFLAHETSCSLYYVCDSGLAILMTCPHHLHFNTEKNVCDEPANANCKLRSPSDQGPSSGALMAASGPPVVMKSPGKRDSRCPAVNRGMPVFLAHETNCALYYVCDTGLAIEMGCPHHLLFNTAKNVCDDPHNVRCPSKTSPASGPSSGALMAASGPPVVMKSPGKRDSRCPAVNRGMPVFLAHETNCALYYVCDTGLAIEMGCPHHLLFNTAKNVCDEPQNVRCPSKTSPASADLEPQQGQI